MASHLEEDSDEENSANEDGASGESSEEEGCDIEFPRDSASDLLQFLHRELNNMGNVEDA